MTFPWGVLPLVLGLFGSPGLHAVERQALRGHVPAAVLQTRPVGRLDPNSRLEVSVGLPWRNPEGLAALLAEIYTPSSARFRRYLTAEEIASRFGPSEADYQEVIDFAEANGLKVTGRHPNRLLVNLDGRLADIERAFHTTLRLYRHPTEARQFRAPETEPSVDLRAKVLRIGGLDNFRFPKALSRRAPTTDRPRTAVHYAGSGPGGSFMGKDFRSAYAPGVTLDGAGQIVGIFALDGFFPTDITVYRQQSGLPAVPVEAVLIDGFDGVPTSRQPGSGNEEVALDIEMAISMAPGLAKVLVYEGPPDLTATTINNILNRMATDNLARQCSCSWGFDIDVVTQQIFQQMAAQGQAFFQASGDNGAYVGPVGQPSDSPWITIVGGTALTTRTTRAYVSETVWAGSGGGISGVYSLPDWQEDIDFGLCQASPVWRNVPDVAMVASNVWVIADRGSSFAGSGTSIAAPLWAGFTALVNQQAAAQGTPPVGFLNPALYRIAASADYTNAFHDITVGNNANKASPKRFFAAPGYDLCTGLGSPNGTNLIHALLNLPLDALDITPKTGFTASGPAGGPFTATALDYTLTNRGSEPLTWALDGLPAWLSASTAGGTLAPGGPAAPLTIGLNAYTSNLLLGSHRARLTVSDLTHREDQSLDFALVVGNGGFESSDLSTWKLSGSASRNFAASLTYDQFGAPSTFSDAEDSQFVRSGLYGALLGEPNALGSLSQRLPTQPGQTYLLSLWLSNPAPGTPNEFRVLWNGAVLYSQANLGMFSWTNLQFRVQASAPSTLLEFDFRHSQRAFGLDDVSVQLLPAPTLQAAALKEGTLTLTWTTVVGLSYQPQYTSDLLGGPWLNLGNPIIATRDSLSLSDAISLNTHRLYRIVLRP